MPPLMSESIMEMIAGGQTQRKTNFSIDAIMSAPKIKEEQDVCEDDIDVGKEEIDNDLIDNELVEKVKKEPKVSSRISSKSNSATLNELKCTLENKDLWDKFSEFGTEMIITRTGRRMFPTVRVAFNNIEKMVVAAGPGLNSAAARFHVLLDIVPADNKRYRYAYHRSQWLVAGKADPAPPHRLYCHPDAPFTAEQLKKQVISFEKVKVTNNESDNTGQVNISIFTSSLLARKQILFLEFFALNDFFNHGGNLSQITTKTLSCGSLFAKEFKLSLGFYVRNLLEIKGFNCLAIVVLISFETPSLSPPAVSAETVSIYIPCLPKPFNEFSGELRRAGHGLLA